GGLFLPDPLLLLLAAFLGGGSVIAAPATATARSRAVLHRRHGLLEHLVDRLLVDAPPLLAILLPALGCTGRSLALGLGAPRPFAACGSRYRPTATGGRRRSGVAATCRPRRSITCGARGGVTGLLIIPRRRGCPTRRRPALRMSGGSWARRTLVAFRALVALRTTRRGGRRRGR